MNNKLLVLLMFSLGFLIGCRSVPITDRNQLMLTTASYENTLGNQTYEEYKKKYKRSTNAEYNQALNRVGQSIKQAANQGDFNWQFIVFDSEIQNAFCLPGGKVAVYSGLIDVMKNEAELACVVAHEAAHAIARHGGERMSWAEIQKLGALGVALGFNDETLNNIYGTGSQLGVILPFSRSNEYEADYIGLILMAQAGYNPRAAIDFWTRFSTGKDASLVEQLTSTHPCDADRIKNFYNSISDAEAIYKQSIVKKGYGTIFTTGRTTR